MITVVDARANNDDQLGMKEYPRASTNIIDVRCRRIFQGGFYLRLTRLTSEQQAAVNVWLSLRNVFQWAEIRCYAWDFRRDRPSNTFPGTEFWVEFDLCSFNAGWNASYVNYLITNRMRTVGAISGLSNFYEVSRASAGLR